MTGAVESADADARDARSAVAANPFWYHTIEVAPGVVTPGVFDLRTVVDRLPWPDVRGRRCLDVGTYDGFLAFELERRGAAEVVAADIADHDEWDWPPRLKARGSEYLRTIAGPERGHGLRTAARLLRSSVRLEEVSVYDLDPEALGRFDVVVCGSLLLHLRDPLRALDAMRAVCAGHLMTTNQVDLVRSLVFRRRPLLRLDGISGLCQWWLPNVDAHRRMIVAAGFDIDRESGLFAEPYGEAHPPRRGPRALVAGVLRRAATGDDGVPHHAVLAHPAV